MCSRLAEKFHVPGCGWPSCFLLEARSAGKLKTSQCFAVFFFCVGMLSVHKAACCKGCIFISEGCCSFPKVTIFSGSKIVIIWAKDNICLCFLARKSCNVRVCVYVELFPR